MKKPPAKAVRKTGEKLAGRPRARQQGVPSEPTPKQRTLSYMLYRAAPLERITIIKKGILANNLAPIASSMGITIARLLSILALPRRTVDRKIRSRASLSIEHSERVVGLETLIGQVEDMVAQAGEVSKFDAHRWVGHWLEQPLAALAQAKPADFMDTVEGQRFISQLLAQAQSGVFA